MAIKAYIYNGGRTPIELEPRNGLVYRDEYNETRDSATIVIRTPDHLDVEPFDFVRIAGGVSGNVINGKSLVVDSISEEQASFGDDPSYDTTISLFSETKELERVPLPNLSITTRPDGTSESVYYHIKKYLDEFAPKIKVSDEDSFIFENSWGIAPEVETRFSSIQCPEFSWNKPTLSEVLTDLMQVDDCIPVIKDHIIGFIDLRERKGEADSSNFVRVVRGMNSQDYNQNLTVNMQNAISTRPAHMVEYVSMRTEDGAILTVENMKVVTQKPIYEIKKVTAIFIYETTTGGVNPQTSRTFAEIDMTHSVKEKMAYDVLSPVPVGFSDQFDFRDKTDTHQVANVWFVRGGRSIDGFGKNFVFPLNQTEMAIRYILRGYLGDDDRSTQIFASVDFRDLMFKVEYMSQGEVTINAGRKLPLRNPHTAVFDNQGSSYVDIRQQSLFEYAKANRLANRIVEINGTCHDDADVPLLGQTYKGAVIFSREIQYHDDLISFHLFATDNYVLSNYFTSIKSRRRSWAIASGREALTRHENVKLYAEFSRQSRTDETATDAYVIYFADFSPARVLSPLYRFYNDESIKLARVTTFDSENNRYPTEEESGQFTSFILDCQASASGLSVSFSIQFTDNYSAGETITIDSNGRYINNLLPYADSNGEFARMQVYFASYVDPSDGDFVWGGYRFWSSGGMILEQWPEVTIYSDDNFHKERIAKARKKPVSYGTGNSENQLVVTRKMHKDNREILALTAQVEYCADDPDIIVKERFVANNYLIAGEQESYLGLPILATAQIMTPLTLPEATSATLTPYRSVGFLYRDSTQFGTSALRYATTAYIDNAVQWQFAEIEDDQKFAIMEGYYESASNEPSATKYIASRIRIAKISEDKTGLVYFEKRLRLFYLNRKLKEEEDRIPTGTTVLFNPSSVTISRASVNSMHIRFSTGAVRKCWGFCDAEGYVLLAFNSKGDTGVNSSDIYLNLAITRDKTIRQDVEHSEVVVGRV